LVEALVRTRWSFPLVALSLAIPVASLAAAPFETPPQPNVPLGPPAFEAPPQGPPVSAPPFDFGRPDLPNGSPIPLPGEGSGIPDLVGVVDLPPGALEHVLDQAPPFGGEHGSAGFQLNAVPEPATGALIVLGLAALAARKRTR
jgi:hypothetical protein